MAGADVARPGKAVDNRAVSGPRGLPNAVAEASGPVASPPPAPSDGTFAPFGESRGATPGHVGTSSGPGKR